MFDAHQARHARAHWRGCGAWKHAAFSGQANRFSHFFQADQAPVNIRETADYYELFLFAPGLTKDAFSVSVADDTLIISAAVGADDSSGRGKWIHQEYQRGGFERRFQLNKKIDTDAINAKYQDGVLELTLPKAPGSAAQDISVA